MKAVKKHSSHFLKVFILGVAAPKKLPFMLTRLLTVIYTLKKLITTQSYVSLFTIAV